MSKLCPQCGRELERVTQGEYAMLNSEQFDAVKAGDYACGTCPDNNRGKSGKAYFWEREIIDTQSRGLTDTESLREIAKIAGQSCDEDVIMAVERVLASASEQLQKADAENLRLHETLETAETAFVILHEKWLTAEKRQDMNEAMDALAAAFGRKQ